MRNKWCVVLKSRMKNISNLDFCTTHSVTYINMLIDLFKKIILARTSKFHFVVLWSAFTKFKKTKRLAQLI